MNSSPFWKRQFQKRGKYYRLNYNIVSPTLRVLDETGKQIGVFSKDEALRRAREQGLDLVEIAPKAQPPVCKIIDFKKFKYLESKKERENKKKTKNVELKQITLSPFIQEHDLLTKAARGKEFLKDGNKLKLIVKFKGRQLAKKEFGFSIINKFIESIREFGTIERPVHLEGPMVVASLIPVKKRGLNETQNEKIDIQKIQSDEIGQNAAKTSK